VDVYCPVSLKKGYEEEAENGYAGPAASEC